jgi:hypothetical protein
MKQNTPAKTRKGRWSAVDTVIVLLVLIAVAGLVYRVVYAARTENKNTRTMYRMYFDVVETHEAVLAEIQGFDAVYLYENGVKLGYIGVYEDTATGEYTVALTPTYTEANDMATATGCLVCTDGVMKDGGLLVGESGRYLTPGSELQVRTDRALLTIRITSIREHK